MINARLILVCTPSTAIPCVSYRKPACILCRFSFCQTHFGVHLTHFGVHLTHFGVQNFFFTNPVALVL